MNQMGMDDNQRLALTLGDTAVRILRRKLSKTVRMAELKSMNRVLRITEHPNVLCEQKLTPGISTSQLYSESLQQFIRSRLGMYPSRRFGMECVLSALSSAVEHLHKNNLGHFDIKPDNILIKWVCQRGYFKQSTVVLADFGLCAMCGST